MNVLKRFLYCTTTLFMIVITISSCEKPEPLDPDSTQSYIMLPDGITPQEFGSIMFSTTDPNQPTATNGPVVIDTTITSTNSQRCTTHTVSQNGAFGEMIILGGLDWYPGKVFTAKSIADGSYVPFLFGERAPICVSSSLPVSNSKMTYSARQSAFNQAHNDYLNQSLNRDVPIQADYSFERIFNKEHLAVAMGAHLKVGKWVSISGSYSNEDTQDKTKMVIKLIQPFYSLNTDDVTPNKFYTVPPTRQEMQGMQVDENGLVYVSKIVYGRQLLFIMESTASESDVAWAINSEFGFWKVNGGFEYSDRAKKVFQESSMRVVVMGGDPTLGAEIITGGLEGVASYINRGAAFDPKTNPGVPLSYELKRVKDNSVFNVVIASEYKTQQCEEIQTDKTETIQPEQRNYLCPNKTSNGGNDKFGQIFGLLEVEYFVSGSQIKQKIHAIFSEEPSLSANCRCTRSEGYWEYVVGTVPNGYYVKDLPSASSFRFGDIPNVLIDVYTNKGLFKRIEVVAQTGGQDLPCEGNYPAQDRTHIEELQFHPIQVLLGKR